MVRGHDNIFLDVSNTNFTIGTTTATFSLSYDGVEGGQNKSVCQGQQTSFTLKYGTVGGFSSNSNISVAGIPSGTTVSLSSTTASTTSDIILTVATTLSVAPGIYQLVVSATSGATTKGANVYLDVQNGNFTIVSGVSPVSNATGQPTSVNLNWTGDAAATFYNLIVSTDVDFTNIIVDGNVSGTSFTVSGLSANANYFWKVKPKNSSCEGNFGESMRFTTGSSACTDHTSTNVPIAISASGTPTINSILTVPTTLDNISSVTVTVNISHSYTADLTATLISPNGTQIVLCTNQCGSNNDVSATFSDLGTANVCGGTPTISGTVLPSQALTGLNAENPSGNWTLRIFDNANADGGALNAWSMNICTSNNNALACGDISTTWNGSVWTNGFPVDNVSATIDGNLALNRNLEACNLTLINNSEMTVQSGINILIQNEVSIESGSDFWMENNSNLVQVNNVANTGSAVIKRNSNPLMRLDYTTSPTLLFSNAQRVGNNENQFFRLAPIVSTSALLQRQRIWLNLTNENGFFAQTMIGFMESALNAEDNLDGKYIGDSSTFFASKIGDDNFAVQLKALPFTDNAVFPMNFASSAAGSYSNAIDHIDSAFAGQEIFLKDNQNQILVNLESGYDFSTSAGAFPGRFEVVFRDPSLETTEFNMARDVMVAVSDNIKIRSQSEHIAAVSISDLLGRKIYDENAIGKNVLTIDDFQKQQQALIIKIVLESGIVVYMKVVF